jgi:pilus assembly protein FimV
MTEDKGETMFKSLKINALALAMVLAAESVGAAGLGRLSVFSALGQPLKAEIELLAVQPEETGSLVARLASSEAFRQARMERADALGTLQFGIEQRPGGQSVLRITSSQAINDPFLDLLIELNWSSGRILREYTVLLDPPSDARAAAEPVAPANVATTRVREKPAPAAETPKSKPAAEATSEKRAEPKPEGAPAKPEGATPGKNTYGPVKAGETLRAIAGKVKPAEISVEMMVAGLYQSNKKSFAHDNMNLLRKGQTLVVPEQDTIQHMFNPKQAHDLIREHGTAWNAYRGKVADMAAKPAAEATPAQPAKDSSKGKVVAAPEAAKPAPAPAKGADVLKLSKGQPGPDAKTQQRQQILEEEVAAKSRSLKEANERVAQLEQNVKDMQRLIKMKDQQPKPAPAAPTVPEVKTPPAVPAAPAPKPAPAPVATPAKAAPPPVTPEEPGFFASLLENPMYIGGALAAILLGGIGWIAMSRRRHRDMTELEQNVINSGDDFKTAIFRTTAGATTQTQTQTTQQTSVMTDFSRLGLGAIDTHEVDPIAEAEVYMAYGRDAQAEEILKEALNKDPGRHEIALKLLEIYATRRDTVAFETQASEIYAALAGQPTPIWAKVTELGRSIDPDNPLYQFKGMPDYPVAPEPEAYRPGADVLGDSAPAEIFQGDLDNMGGYESETPTGPMDKLFTDEAMPDEEPPSKVAEDDDGVIDFQIDLDRPSVAEEINIPPVMAPNPFSEPAEGEARNGLDFPEIDFSNLSMGESEAETPADEHVAEFSHAAEGAPESLPDLDFTGIDLELSEPMSEPSPGIAQLASTEAMEVVEAKAEAIPDEGIDPEIWEEVNTKLDLAKAYLEMGDKEGAREILDEVVHEGDSQQKSLANELLASTA